MIMKKVCGIMIINIILMQKEKIKMSKRKDKSNKQRKDNSYKN